MKLSVVEIDRVSAAVHRGARMLVGRDHMGRQKLKLIRGPFGLFVERYDCTEEDLAQIRAKLSALQGNKARSSVKIA